jgi:hypothetical protein
VDVHWQLTGRIGIAARLVDHASLAIRASEQTVCIHSTVHIVTRSCQNGGQVKQDNLALTVSTLSRGVHREVPTYLKGTPQAVNVQEPCSSGLATYLHVGY